MVRVSRILKDFRETGALNSLSRAIALKAHDGLPLARRIPRLARVMHSQQSRPARDGLLEASVAGIR
jgi:hypothetical protein